MIHLSILRPVDGPDLLRDLAARPFLNPGRLDLEAGRKIPTWLPPAPEYLYVGRGGDIFGARLRADGTSEAPQRLGDLVEIVFGRTLLQRFAHSRTPGFTFDTQEVKTLATCLEDDTQIDLPAAKAHRLIGEGKPIHLTRDVLTYAALEAVRAVGRGNARYASRQPVETQPHHVRLNADPAELWTLRRVFGTIS